MNFSGVAQNGTPYAYFIIRWEGTDDSGNYLVPGNYTYKITYSNCFQSTVLTEIGALVYNGTPQGSGRTTPITYPGNLASGIPDCCIDYWLYQDITLPTIENRLVGDYILAGEMVTSDITNGPVIIQPQSQVLFHAGNEVILEPGVEVQYGAEFLALADYECPPGKRSRDMISSTSLQDLFPQYRAPSMLEQIKVRPNPSTGTFTFQLQTNQGDDISIGVVDNMGREVWRLQPHILDDITGVQNVSFSLDKHPQGIYYLLLKQNEAQRTIKLMKS